MTWKELYKETKDNKFKEVIKIKKDMNLKAKSINFIKEKHKIILPSIAVILIVLTLLFYSDLNLLFSLLLLILATFGMISYFNSYSISCSNKQLHIAIAMDDIWIDYTNIKNIYLEESTFRIFFRKIKKYHLVVMYETAYTHNISDISLPTLFVKPRRDL